MPPITTTAKTTIMKSAPISGDTLIDRRRQNPGESRQRHAEAISQRDHTWHIDAEGAGPVSDSPVAARNSRQAVSFRSANQVLKQTAADATITQAR